MVYHSKKDWWLMALVWFGVLLPSLIGIYLLIVENGSGDAGWTMLFTSVFIAGVVLVLTYPLYYEIREANLIVRCGVLVRKEIPLSSIVEARPTTDPLSAPAWSLDRVRIDYRKNGGRGFVLISPDDKLEFIRELADRTGLEVRGERVISTP